MKRNFLDEDSTIGSNKKRFKDYALKTISYIILVLIIPSFFTWYFFSFLPNRVKILKNCLQATLDAVSNPTILNGKIYALGKNKLIEFDSKLNQLRDSTVPITTFQSLSQTTGYVFLKNSDYYFEPKSNPMMAKSLGHNSSNISVLDETNNYVACSEGNDLLIYDLIIGKELKRIKNFAVNIDPDFSFVAVKSGSRYVIYSYNNGGSDIQVNYVSSSPNFASSLRGHIDSVSLRNKKIDNVYDIDGSIWVCSDSYIFQILHGKWVVKNDFGLKPSGNSVSNKITGKPVIDTSYLQKKHEVLFTATSGHIYHCYPNKAGSSSIAPSNGLYLGYKSVMPPVLTNSHVITALDVGGSKVDIVAYSLPELGKGKLKMTHRYTNKDSVSLGLYSVDVNWINRSMVIVDREGDMFCLQLPPP